MLSSFTRFLTVLTVICVLTATTSNAHNWLLEPYAFNTNWRTTSCTGSECSSACPEIMEPNKMNNVMDEPGAIWRRGQRVRICYARNNHHGGMARFSLVPVNVMTSRDWHEKLTLFHTCWGAGETQCSRGRMRRGVLPCGTDRESTAYCRYTRIPTVFPDGDYVLGHVWYGGLRFSRDRGQFADYYSCSFVRIQGGPMTCEPHKPYFEPGKGPGVHYGQCLTSSKWIGDCGQIGCPRRHAFYSTPTAFRGDGPEPIRCSTVEKAFMPDSPDMHVLMGICKGDVCCPKECGKCGGPGCEDRGTEEKPCCGGTIRKMSWRKCPTYEPPCNRM